MPPVNVDTLRAWSHSTAYLHNNLHHAQLTTMAARISRVVVDIAALQQILPLVPAAFVNAANQHTTTQGTNALYDYLRSLLGQHGPLSTLAARTAFTALRDLIPRQRFGLPRNRLPDVDRDRAVILRTAGQYITDLLAAAPAAPAAPPPPHPPPPPRNEDDVDDDDNTPLWKIDPRLRLLGADADPNSIV